MLKYDSAEEFRVSRGYLNRTKIYLYPSIVTLKSYPQLRALKDNFLCCSYTSNSIVLYYDRKDTLGIHTALKSLKDNGEHVDDYMHNENVYAIVISPELNYGAFEEGSYTEIYPPDVLKKSFTSDSKTKQVLTKDPNYKQLHVDMLNEWFNTKHTIDNLELRDDGSRVEIQQYDLPPCLNQEILNYERANSYGGGYVKRVHR